MGIPAYFKYITSQYDNLIIKKLDQPIHRLFLDLNCAIHPRAQKVLSDYPNLKNKYVLENKIYHEVLDYIKYILEYTQPQDLLFVSIDGVAPRAKMQQQRYRRFKSVKEKKDKNRIYEKYNEPLNKNDWDTNAITPGTIFMNGLSKYLKKELKNTNSNIKIIFSDSNDPSEGEHKIFKYIKKYDTNGNDAVYGLDADLIMLSMTTQNRNIYLLRESVEFGNIINTNEDGLPLFLYLNITNFKNSIVNELKENGLKVNNDYRIICDYVFMCFLLGNDFLPHTLSLAIKNGGINILLEYYLQISDKNYYLVQINKNKFSINDKFLYELICKISESENELLQTNTRNLLRSRVRNKECSNKFEKELHLYEYLPIFHRDIDKYIDMGSENWRPRYYDICFDTNFESDIDYICFNYLQGLYWTLKYYFEDCVSNSWYYKFRHPPTMLDIKHYLEKPRFNINETVQIDRSVYDPFVQLLIVLPGSSNRLLPENYKYLSTQNQSSIIDMYPNNFQLDTVGKYLTWQCTPILPNADDDRIFEAIKNIPLSKEEMYRNGNRKRYIVKEKKNVSVSENTTSLEIS